MENREASYVEKNPTVTYTSTKLLKEQLDSVSSRALVISVLYLILATIIPLIVLYFFNQGTVVERLRTSE